MLIKDRLLSCPQKVLLLLVACSLWASGCFAASGLELPRSANELKGPTQPVPRTYFGMHIHRADSGTAWPSVPFGTWRLVDAYVNWFDLQPERGKWNFDRLDRYVAMAKLTGVELILPLMMTPAWASARPQERGPYGPGNAAEPRDYNDWRNYVRTVVRRYKGRISAYEIWNEVNEKGFFSGSPEQLMTMVRIASEEIRGNDPAAKVLSPSVVSGGGADLVYLDKLLSLGLGSYVDVIAHHFYVPHGKPEEIIRAIRAAKGILQKRGMAALPFWNTETGWRIENGDGTPEGKDIDPSWKRVSLRESSGYVARALILARSEGVVRFCWYAWDHGNMGLIEPREKTLKPAAVAYKSVFAWLTQNALLGCAKKGDVWQCDIQGANGRPGWIVWSEDKSVTWSPNAYEGEVQIHGVLGSAENRTIGQRMGVPVSGDPILILTGGGR